MVSTEKCAVSYWNTDEDYHTGVCKCHLILCDEESHNYAIKRHNDIGHWKECSECESQSDIYR